MIGFNSEVELNHVEEKDLLSKVEPEDLLKFGLIPEFIGRLPVIVTLDELDEQALIRIMKEPKNALIKQYKKLFDLDGVDLEIDDGAIEEIAKRAIARKTGARGLRSIFEKAMMDTMFEIPSRADVKKCRITRETIAENREPEILTSGSQEERKAPEESADQMRING